MKITYPECQIEISVEEVITLMDHANLTDAGTRLVHEIEDYKEKLHEVRQVEELPEEPGLTLEDEPDEHKAQDPLEGVDFEESKQKPKGKNGKKGNKPKKVDVRLDNGEWFTFDSVSAAAESIGGKSNGLSTALKNGTMFHGREVRWTNPELDAALAEIDKSNKIPYQPSHKL